MDPRLNPYAPGAGSKPPALVGRDDQITAFDLILERLERGCTEQSMIITGLRGVGKTVLLDVLKTRSENRGWASVEWEVEKNIGLGARIGSHIRRALLQLEPRSRWNDRLKRAASILKSFTLTFSPDGGVTAGLDVEALQGVGDSGVISEDLTDLFVALGEAARDRSRGVVFLIDEIQYLSRTELEALIAALHRCTRRALPITLVGAGLPQLPKLAGEAKSYSERLFRFREIGRLDLGSAARDALVLPARGLGVEFAREAVDFIVDYTQGYPYFLQEYGKVIWDEAAENPISRREAEAVRPLVETKLDESFFRVRSDRTSELELRYLLAMARLGPEAHRASDVAKALDRSAQSLGPVRSRLIDKGLLYTPGYGYAAFTVPQFDRFLIRSFPDDVQKRA